LKSNLQSTICNLQSRLYAIVDVDAAAAAGWTPPDLARAYIAGGARLLQLRGKQLASGAFLELARTIVEMGRSDGADVIINDRADIAALAQAAGVHVGQEDLSPREVRRVVGNDTAVGLSTHTLEQLEHALGEPITYIAVGPVFSTATKDTGYAEVGLSFVAAAARLAAARGLPLVAIGGITLDRARSVMEAGAASVAVIGDLLATGNPEARVREYVRALAL
jgi:thiamine-phosphate pyrophosphorylase